MKFFLGLIVFIVLLIVGTWYMGGFHSPSPKELADQIRTGVTSGMTWEQVAAIRQPRHFHPFVSASFTGQSSGHPYNKETIETMIKDGNLPEGFAFQYNFSEAQAVSVSFDQNGFVTSVNDMMTMKDLVTGSMFIPTE